MEGDYYQLWLDVTDSDVEETDPFEPTGPYLILQRDFETPDRGWCYIETHDADYVGHFRLRLTELSRTRLAFEIVRARNNHVEVFFSMSASEFKEVRRIAEVTLVRGCQGWMTTRSNWRLHRARETALSCLVRTVSSRR